MKKELFSKHYSIGSNGHLQLDGVDLLEVAKEFGTPAYVMSDLAIREQCRAYMQAMRRNFGDQFVVTYASKALSSGFVYKIVGEEGLHADAVSGGELYTALHAGFPAAHLHFNGNNKTDEELAYAVREGIGLVIIDNHAEISRLEAICARQEKQMEVAIRVKPGVDAHTHEFISTGHNDSKFGFGITDGQAMEAARLLADCKHLKFVGLHCHIGSQIFEKEPFAVAADAMFGLMRDIQDQLGLKLTEYIAGGGFGVKYMPEDKPVDTDEMIDFLAQSIKASAKKYGLELPKVVIEPGRSTVSMAGCTLYTVGGVKEIKDVRTYVSVDGGMADNPRYALYQAQYDACIVEKALEDASRLVSIAGRCCESGDMVTRDIVIQEPKPGDTLCVFSTGAYNFSMASNYNSLPRPPIVLVKDGRAQLVVRRQTYADLTQYEV